MAFAATIHRTVRGHQRTDTEVDGTLRNDAATAIDVVLENLSRGGFRIRSEAKLNIGELVSLGVPGLGVRRAAVVWRSGEACGCDFQQTLSTAELDAVLAASASEPIPFPIATHDAGYALEPMPGSDRYPRRVRLVSLFALAATGWALIGATARMVI